MNAILQEAVMFALLVVKVIYLMGRFVINVLKIIVILVNQTLPVNVDQMFAPIVAIHL